MSNRRRILNSINRDIDRKRGVNAAAWFAGQSFTSAHRGDMPLTRLTDQQVNEAGAGLLPATVQVVCSGCYGSRETEQHVTDDITRMLPCRECHGRGYVEVER